MCNLKYIHVLFLFTILYPQRGYTQDSTLSKISSLPDKLLASIDQKTSALEAKLDKQTARYLVKLKKQENRLQKKFLKRDSSLAKQLFSGVDSKYKSLQSQPQNTDTYSSVYSGHLDSLTTALNFLKGTSALKDMAQVDKTLNNLQGLQGRFNHADQVKKYLQQRRQLLQEQFKKLGMSKELKKYQKQVYYYGAQVKEYKQIL